MAEPDWPLSILRPALPTRLRVFSAIAAVILVGAAIVVLARAGVIPWPAEVAGLLPPAVWILAVALS